MKCVEEFQNIYKKQPDDVAFCPYRISPLGAHIDHQFGCINGFAIDKGIHFAYRAKSSGICELYSLQFPGVRAQFAVNAVPGEKQQDWADYLRGATLKLGEKYKLRYGVAGVLEGSLPIGGLSSSAAVTIVYLTALCKVNGITLSAIEMIMTAKLAENEYVGVNCGKLDQSCEVLCRKDQLLFLDNKDDSYELIPQNPAMKPYKIAIFFSGLEHALSNSKYNSRQDECKAAAYALKALSGMEYEKFIDTRLRDVPEEIYHRYKDQLPENWRKRAEHYYTEQARAIKGAELWRRGDLEGYGKLVFESGRSSVFNYESGSPELIGLYNILCETDGVYGGRLSGAGFKGCCMALIDPDKAEAIEQSVGEKYKAAFPEYAEKYMSCICESADGVLEQMREER